MSRFIRCPNLPERRVDSLALGAKYLPLLGPGLERMGVRALALPEVKTLPEPVRWHADLVLLHMGGSRFMAAKELECAVSWPQGMELSYLDSELTDAYPGDCRLNICVVGEIVICSARCADGSALEALGGVRLDVKQGYARCSTCVVSREAIITADEGIANACAAKGMDVLLISSGGIRLDGYDTGFIGGSSFKLAPDVLAFTGSLQSHPDCGRITDFLRRHGVAAVNLCDEPLFDVGGAVLLTEE